MRLTKGKKFYCHFFPGESTAAQEIKDINKVSALERKESDYSAGPS